MIRSIARVSTPSARVPRTISHSPVFRNRGKLIIPGQRQLHTSPPVRNRAQPDPTSSPNQDQDQLSHNATSQPVDLLQEYRALVDSGRLKWDDEQVRCVMKLRKLLNTLSEYQPPLDLLAQLAPSAPRQARDQIAKEGVVSRLWNGKGREGDGVFGNSGDGKELVRVLSGEEELANLKTPKGIMLTGPPGTGKSLLLSLLYNNLPLPKKRWHYHAFTLHLYSLVFKEMTRRRQATPKQEYNDNMDKAAKKGWKAVFAAGKYDGDGEEVWVGREETIPFVIARDMFLEYQVLYFDELQLVDASSAALLRDVLSWYWRLGGVMLTCSNRVPDDLYHHGVQKERMAGFLDALKARCEVVELDGGKDWRSGTGEEKGETLSRWFGESDGGFEDAWREALDGEEAAPVDLKIYGRKLHVPLATRTVCRFTFADLCENPLGAADYISLSSAFSTFFVDEVPVLYLRNKNEARRLINLVDALYESRCQIHLRSPSTLSNLFFPDAPPDQTSSSEEDTNESIMAAEALSETLHQPSHPNISVYNPGERLAREKKESLEGKKAGAFGVLGIWTGEDERFAYKRAVSRLIEMTTSPTYRNEGWIPLDSTARAWETPSTPSLPKIKVPTLNRSNAMNDTPRETMPGSDEGRADDWADEAGYSRPQLLQPRGTGPREGAPVIKEHHMWGVTDEWGDKAGKWGKGAKAFKGGEGEKK